MLVPLLSICIPTYGRVEILRNTLDSIFSQNVSTEIYEVCISDNSPTDETKEMLSLYFSDRNNIQYVKSTCEGYFNSIEALKLGSGKFLKLHNNYSKFKKGTFGKFVNTIIQFSNDEPLLFFTSNSIKTDTEFEDYNTFDVFLNRISYFSTWSTSFGIWKNDFDCLIKQNTKLDKMFPHTSLLFALYEKNNFVIDNTLYFENQDVGKKGGYNLPETFGTRYLGMCNDLFSNGIVSKSTFDVIKKNILNFIAEWYANVLFFGDKYTFSFENWETIISNLYGLEGVEFLKRNIKKRKLRCMIRKILKRY